MKLFLFYFFLFLFQTEISDVFALFDNKGDNKIAASQLGDCLRALNQNPNESEIKKCGYSGNPGEFVLISESQPRNYLCLMHVFLLEMCKVCINLFMIQPYITQS